MRHPELPGNAALRLTLRSVTYAGFALPRGAGLETGGPFPPGRHPAQGRVVYPSRARTRTRGRVTRTSIGTNPCRSELGVKAST